MPFAEIQGQEVALGFLRRMLRHGRVPGALLFAGPPHVGKRGMALALAQALNCEALAGGFADLEAPDACGACPSCRQIAAGVHPDVQAVLPEGQFIKIDQVRQVIESLALIPLLARRRVVVLARAECLNLESANALLKVLEEPPADSLLVLCASQPQRLPDTIRSRCMPVRFAPLEQAVLRGLFAEPTGGKGAQAAGLQGAALDFAVRFAQGQLRPVLRAQAETWLGWREHLVRALQELQQGPSLTLEEHLPQWSQAEGLDFVLEWLESWFRDLALLGAGGAEQALINADQAAALRALLPAYPPAWAARCQEAVLATRQAQALNANRSLALEALWYSFKPHDAAA